MSKNKKIVLTLAILMGLGAMAWALLPTGPDPQLVKVQQLQQKLFDPDAKIPIEDRRKAFGEFRQEAEKLTPEQRDSLMRENPFAKRMQQTVVSYFDLPENQRVAALDKEIDRFEKFRKDMEKRRGDRPGGGPPGGFGRGNMNDGQQNEMRKKMLDNTSPQQRAMFGEYMQQMQDRRRDRGLPDMGGPFGGR